MDKFSLAKFGVVVKRCFQASGKPLRLHLRSSGESTYTLIKNHHISSSTIDKLRHNKPLNTTTINDLCRILSCKVEDSSSTFPAMTTRSYKANPGYTKP